MQWRHLSLQMNQLWMSIPKSKLSMSCGRKLHNFKMNWLRLMHTFRCWQIWLQLKVAYSHRPKYRSSIHSNKIMEQELKALLKTTRVSKLVKPYQLKPVLHLLKQVRFKKVYPHRTNQSSPNSHHANQSSKALLMVEARLIHYHNSLWALNSTRSNLKWLPKLPEVPASLKAKAAPCSTDLMPKLCRTEWLSLSTSPRSSWRLIGIFDLTWTSLLTDASEERTKTSICLMKTGSWETELRSLRVSLDRVMSVMSLKIWIGGISSRRTKHLRSARTTRLWMRSSVSSLLTRGTWQGAMSRIVPYYLKTTNSSSRLSNWMARLIGSNSSRSGNMRPIWRIHTMLVSPRVPQMAVEIHLVRVWNKALPLTQPTSHHQVCITKRRTLGASGEAAVIAKQRQALRALAVPISRRTKMMH